jgi:hypothetical protein
LHDHYEHEGYERKVRCDGDQTGHLGNPEFIEVARFVKGVRRARS